MSAFPQAITGQWSPALSRALNRAQWIGEACEIPTLTSHHPVKSARQRQRNDSATNDVIRQSLGKGEKKKDK